MAHSPDSDGGGKSKASEDSEAITSPTDSDVRDSPETPINAFTPRSCYTCNRKKVRCDKREPCTPCRKSEKQCEYPPAGPRKRRTKKTIIQEMASRISGLEKSLAAANKIVHETDTPLAPIAKRPRHVVQPQAPRQALHTPPVTPATTITAETSNITNTASREDLLVRKGFGIQHFDEAVLSKIISDVSFPVPPFALIKR